LSGEFFSGLLWVSLNEGRIVKPSVRTDFALEIWQ
jgi:hypothetical protein